GASERTRVTGAELKAAAALHADIMMDGNSVVETKWTDGEEDAEADAPVVGVKLGLAGVAGLEGVALDLEMEGFLVDVADVVEEGEAKLFQQADAVFDGAEEIGAPAEGFAEGVLGADILV